MAKYVADFRQGDALPFLRIAYPDGTDITDYKHTFTMKKTIADPDSKAVLQVSAVAGDFPEDSNPVQTNSAEIAALSDEIDILQQESPVDTAAIAAKQAAIAALSKPVYAHIKVDSTQTVRILPGSYFYDIQVIVTPHTAIYTLVPPPEESTKDKLLVYPQITQLEE